MPGWLRSALLAACVATACVEHQAPSIDDANEGGAGGVSGGTPSRSGAAGALATGAAAGTSGAPAGGAPVGGTPNGGAPSAGNSAAGTAGTGALAGSGGGSAGGDSSDAGAAGVMGAAGATGEPSVIAIAKLEPTAGSSVTGEARFEQSGDAVKLSVTLSNCPAGAHALHLHQNPDCSDDANASGGTWSPQGEGIDEITCADDGSGKLEFSPAAGTWSIGGSASSDLLRHAVVLHAGGNSEAAARIACGLPLLQP